MHILVINSCSHDFFAILLYTSRCTCPSMQVQNNKHKHVATPLATIASLVYLDTSTVTVLYIYTIVA